ncbi:hypothetical protein [Ammoniphilus resinae]|uniref:Uncharacterized protein n=1 Tax=Ammoniphilus resinae TaxID=861532 RepID=A0ABS4GSW8_9BACL|nr:hypothetical protein [Ammoniphilus resinae]MBP1933361.1 hypothetical protein [Ammoniphilus resinae]
MLRNKKAPTAVVKGSYHEYVLNQFRKEPHKESFEVDRESMERISLLFSGYIDRLHYAEHENVFDLFYAVHEIIAVVQQDLLALKALTNELIHIEMFTARDMERLTVFEKLSRIHHDLCTYLELQEASSVGEYPELAERGGRFLDQLLEIKHLLQLAGIETEHYDHCVSNLQFKLKGLADELQAYTTHTFGVSFDEKHYIPLAALCFGIYFIKDVANYLEWEVISNLDDHIRPSFPARASVLYSLGEDFTFGSFE